MLGHIEILNILWTYTICIRSWYNAYLILWFQDEEIEALAAIYGDDWEVVDSESRKYHIRISDEKLKNAILMEVCIKKKTISTFHWFYIWSCMTFIDKAAFTHTPFQFELLQLWVFSKTFENILTHACNSYSTKHFPIRFTSEELMPISMARQNHKIERNIVSHLIN